jgi:ribosomal protein L11 methyltransferase
VADVYAALETGGTYIASGIIKSKEAVVASALEEAGFTIRERNEDQDWVALVAEKR